MNTNSVQDLVNAVVSTINLHSDWPVDAVYKVWYDLKCWPTSWSHHQTFLSSKEELKEWYAGKLDWATLEDNYFMLTGLEEWDLGPNVIIDPIGFINL